MPVVRGIPLGAVSGLALIAIKKCKAWHCNVGCYGLGLNTGLDFLLLTPELSASNDPLLGLIDHAETLGVTSYCLYINLFVSFRIILFIPVFHIRYVGSSLCGDSHPREGVYAEANVSIINFHYGDAGFGRGAD